jgi:hypothetical protein
MTCCVERPISSSPFPLRLPPSPLDPTSTSTSPTQVTSVHCNPQFRVIQPSSNATQVVPSHLRATVRAIRKALSSASVSNQSIPSQSTDPVTANTAIQYLPSRVLQVVELRVPHHVGPADAALVAALAQADRPRRLRDGLAGKAVDQVVAHGRVGPVGAGAGLEVGAAALVEVAGDRGAGGDGGGFLFAVPINMWGWGSVMSWMT